ncbi:PREDICTED: ATP-binding cassette sub-family B member 9 isoform X2 [Condylura cristata]|uniref:ATP-binding cassette sub-family B member 9 isoform X2 n=1 Tax=Condylura cristata TaxID=143302 RepID=UPI000643D5D4|nr:PREDICTED: ATP-binding cassette sub-family B member 9 isoform X2 [Condylura cristata]
MSLTRCWTSGPPACTAAACCWVPPLAWPRTVPWGPGGCGPHGRSLPLCASLWASTPWSNCYSSLRCASQSGTRGSGPSLCGLISRSLPPSFSGGYCPPCGRAPKPSSEVQVPKPRLSLQRASAHLSRPRGPRCRSCCPTPSPMGPSSWPPPSSSSLQLWGRPSYPTIPAGPSMALSSRRAWSSSARPSSSCVCWPSAGIRGGIFTLIFARLNIRLRNRLFRSLVSQETSFFDENRTGDLISRLTSDTTMVSDLVSQNINIFLRNTVKVTGVVVFMFSLSWQLSLVTFMGFPIIMMVSDIYGKYYKRLSKEVQNALARASNTAEETISAMKTVRSFANEEEEAEVYLRKLQQVYKLNRKEAAAYTYYVWGSGLTLLVVQVSILYYGGHLVISGQMTSGNLISFIIYEFVLGDCMESVGSVYSGLMQGVGAAEKVFEFIDRQPTMVHDGNLAPDHLEGRVDFENVTFTYRTRPHTQVLQNVSFSLSPGKVTALVGPSGSGKSSCVNILENFYPLEGGRVLLDGKPISAYDHKYLHRVISLVSQEPVLFARSITDNISYGLPTVPFEMVVEAAQKANAHGFIMELQDGYNTETGEKGAQLSGGQKQRVAMARALVRNPPVLILDEATSALDAESEYLIQQAIHGNLQKHTVLIIAHRLSTVERAHCIVVLDKGRVVQQGTHQQLLAQGGLYAKLVQRQMLGLEPASDYTACHKDPSSNGSHRA